MLLIVEETMQNEGALGNKHESTGLKVFHKVTEVFLNINFYNQWFKNWEMLQQVFLAFSIYCV